MKFWEKHSEEMRKARLLQSAAVMYANNPNMSLESAVRYSFEIEEEIDRVLKAKAKKK